MCIVFLLLEFVFAMLCLGAVLLVALFISRVSGYNAIWEYSVSRQRISSGIDSWRQFDDWPQEGDIT